jgi:parallel beta-helix repeat protein
MEEMGMNRQFVTIAAVLVLVLAGIYLFRLIPEIAVHAIYVANNGTDSSNCGSRDSPCRSISQAAANANPGNTIKVGPGHYGDLNKNGTFGEPGEEFAQSYAMIVVDKPLTIISSAGPQMTVLDANHARLSVVLITANNVVFGKPEHGFMLTGANANGLSTASVSNVTISGNAVLGNGQGGIVVDGSANLLHDNFASGNLAAGFAVFGRENTVRDNISTSNGSEGFVVVGAKHAISHNASSNNSIGFGIQGTDMRLLHNSALGNKLFGISVQTLGASAAISQSNIYGNNNTALNGVTNCGIQNTSGNTIVASDNFWGESTGPGADPADNAGSGSGCDAMNSVTVIAPFASESFKTLGLESILRNH